MNFIYQQYLRIFHRDRFRNQSEGSTKKRDKNAEFVTGAVADNFVFELEDFMQLAEETYSEVETIEQATVLIESCEDLKDTEKVLFLTVQLSDSFGSIDIQKLAQKGKKNSIVIFFESKTGKKFSILWKTKDVESFYTFGHYSMAFDESDRKIYKFIADFLAKSLTRQHLGFKSACTNEEVLLSDLIDHRGFSLLLIAIEQNNTMMAKIMLSLGASIESLDGTVTAQSLAWNSRNSELLLQMAKSNMKYPTGISLSELSEEFRAFYNETEELHAAIKADDNEKIEQVLKRRQHKIRFHFNLVNESAASVAIKQGSDDIYEILLRYDVFLAEDGLLSELSDGYQRIVRALHTKYKKESDDKHINILYSRSHAAHDAMDAQDNMKHVRKAYELMAQNPLLNIILKVVAAVRRFDIIYDFSRDATNVVDPTTSENTEGIFYMRGQIFIGAKQLLDENNKFQSICVIAHELCHFACNILYDNDAQPFAKDDDTSREWFEEINAKCKANKDKERIVRLVYDCYSSDMFLAELIVRVPHMLALYFDQPEKQRECRASYPELFNFYETHLVPKMEKAIPEIEVRSEREIEEKDIKIIKYKFLWIISIILAIIGVIATAFIVHAILFKPVYSFNTLETTEQQRVRDGSIIYKGVELRLHDLFPNDSIAYQKLTSEHITQIFDKIPLNFSSPHLFYLDNQVEFNWPKMSEKLKEKVLNSNFTFQNESLELAEMYKSFPSAFNYLTTGQIVELMDGSLVVGMMIANETKFYVERKLLLEKDFLIEDLNSTHNDYKDFYKNKEITDVTNRTREKLISLNLITNNTEFKIGTHFYGNLRHDNDLSVDIMYDMNEMIDRTQLSRFLILSGEAGSGKSVTFQQMTMKIKRRFPDNWVSYLDLKDYTRFYDSQKISNDALDVLIDILDLKSKSQFELKVFEELFGSGKVVLLWDGFDEISPTFSDQVIELIKFVYENSKSVQHVSTRPLCADLLEKSFNVSFVKLEPYKESGREEFLRKYFSSENVNESEIANLTKNVLKISTKLKYKTPLMLMLIAEVHEDPKNIESLNLYKIYETFAEKRIRIWREKSEANKKTSNKLIAKNTIINIIYQKYAIIKEEISFLNIPRLKIMKMKLPKGLSYDEISRMGILYINNETVFDFAHRTFSEFFVAQFLVENFLELDDDEPFDEVVFELFYTRLSPTIKSILFDHLEDQKFDGTGHFHPKIEKLLRQKHKNYLFSMLFTRDFLDTLKMFLKILSKNRNLLIDMLHVHEDETLYTAYFNPTNNLDLLDFDKIPPQKIENAVAEYLTKDELSKFLTGRNQKGVILYGIATSILKDQPIYHPSYSLGDVNVTEYYNLDFYENIKENLTELERKHLIVAMLLHSSYYFQGKDILLDVFLLDWHKNMWKEGENLLDKEDRKSIIAEMLELRNRIDLTNYSELFDFILDKANATLSSQEIFELFKNQQLCLRSFMLKREDILPFLERLWDFLTTHTSKEQQKEIILQELDFERNKNLRYGTTYNFFLEKNRIKLFHYLLLEEYSIKLNISLSNWFSEAEMRKIILGSNDFMLIFINSYGSNIPELVKTLRKLFVGHEEDLIEFLKRKISGTDYTLFNYFDVKLNLLYEYRLDKINKSKRKIEELIERLETATCTGDPHP